MLGAHTARRAYQLQEISNIGFVISSENIADGLPKSKKQAALLQVLLNGTHQVKCE